MKRSLAVAAVVAALGGVAATSSAVSARSVDPATATRSAGVPRFSGPELARGIFFGFGPVADRFEVMRPPGDAIATKLYRDFADEMVPQIFDTEAEWATFAHDVQSGDPFLVDAALRDATDRFLVAASDEDEEVGPTGMLAIADNINIVVNINIQENINIVIRTNFWFGGSNVIGFSPDRPDDGDIRYERLVADVTANLAAA